MTQYRDDMEEEDIRIEDLGMENTRKAAWQRKQQAMRDSLAASGFSYLAATGFLVLFGAVYEYFSYGVWSYFMVYAFIFPLFGGALPSFLFSRGRWLLPDMTTRLFWRGGILALSIGFIFRGILEIYGTTNRLGVVYWLAGTVMLALAVIRYLASRIQATEAGRHPREA